MRIRRNHWLSAITVTALGLTAFTAGAQTTTTTAEAAGTTATATPYALEAGDQLVYVTKGSMAISGMGRDQDEKQDIVTSVTVLEKQGDSLTVYASQWGSEETTEGTKLTPGPRYTFAMPAGGALDTEEFEKAGLEGTVFPTLSVEGLFPSHPKEGKTTVSLVLPVTNALVDTLADTTVDGDKLKTVAVAEQDGKKVMERTSHFSTSKKVVEAINTSISLSLAAQGQQVSISVTDDTRLDKQTKLTAGEVASLKKDVEAAIPVAAKLRTLQMSSPDVMKSVLEDTKKYLAAHPNGEFSFLFSQLQTQLASAAARTENWDKMKAGNVPPDFTATTIDGKTVKLSDLKGKVVLLDFWATWCGPCMMELPNVKKLYAETKDKGFEIIGISADETQADLEKVVKDEALEWPQVFDGGDKSDSIQEKYGVMKYPTTILVDKEGKISSVDLRGEELDEAVKKLLEPAK